MQWIRFTNDGKVQKKKKKEEKKKKKNKTKQKTVFKIQHHLSAEFNFLFPRKQL